MSIENMFDSLKDSEKNGILKFFKDKFELFKNYVSEFWSSIFGTKDELSSLDSEVVREPSSTDSKGVDQKNTKEDSVYNVDIHSPVIDNNNYDFQFAEGIYPFANVPPYKGIKAYDLRRIKCTPILTYRDLSVERKSGTVVKLSGSNIVGTGKDYPTNNTTGNKNFNPCDISHSNDDIGYKGDHKVADGQKLAEYDSPVDGVASAMRLLYRKYKNKSLTEINTSGLQGKYQPGEEIGLKAVRIYWITKRCESFHVGPHDVLDFKDKTTLESFVAEMALSETGTKLPKGLLDEAYNLAFPNGIDGYDVA